MSKACICLPLFLLAVGAVTDASSAQGEAAIRDLVEAEVAKDECVGVSVAVMRGDEWLCADGFGVAELEHGVTANADTMFRIGSITKQFTAAALMRLVEEGKVTLDADFRDYVPNYPDPGEVVTVRHLLTHTSGIPSYTGLSEWRPTIPLELTSDELLAMVRDRDLEFSPGTAFKYNNTGYYLLGVLIEKVTGDSYGDYVQKAFFEPLGLARTRYGSNSDVIRNRAQGYRMLDGALANDELLGMSQPGAAGALVSTAKDLVRWARALAAGEVVSDESYRQMTAKLDLVDGEQRDYGFGLMLGEMDGVGWVGHGGGINGFNSFLLHVPQESVTVAVISNSEAWDSGEMARSLARSVIGAAAEAVGNASVLAAPAQMGELPVSHRLPKSWAAEKTTSSMRLEQYLIAPGSESRCVVYWFGEGGGGGREANFSRWEQQFEAESRIEVGDIEVAEGLEATLLEAEGTYVAEVQPGSGTRVDEDDWAMLAAYVDVPKGPIFIKLAGPAFEVLPQREAFVAWLQSFRAQ